jgi:ribosomal protein L12E/L44/L45/RPP1/RPP2
MDEASPIVAMRTSEETGMYEVQLAQGKPFYGLLSVGGANINDMDEACTNDATFKMQLLGLAKQCGGTVGKHDVVLELEDMESHEIDDVRTMCTEANLAVLLRGDAAAPGASPKKAAAAEDEEGEEDEEEEGGDIKQNVMQLAEALRGVMAMGAALGLSQDDIQECYVDAGGVVGDFGDDDLPGGGMPGGAPGGQQCPQQ